MEEPVHCLAVEVVLDQAGEIDASELERFLDRHVGRNCWFTTSAWIFARAPVMTRTDFVSVPVICPEPVAARLNLTVRVDRPPRIFSEHVVGAVELRGWRWVAGQVWPQLGGRFPWELEVARRIGPRTSHHL
jgi:hypothetical protein